MGERPSGVNEVEISDLIGIIYDCAIDPARWEPMLDRLRCMLDCVNCMLAVFDLRSNALRMQRVVGIEPQWLARMPEYANDARALMASVPDLMSRPLDEPFVGRRDVSDEVWLANAYHREWGRPQGIVDVIALHLMRGPARIAELGLGRHESFGLIAEREVWLLRLLSPHLRRALVISDLIDMKTIEAEALGRTLDMVPAGVVLVAEDAEILYTNRTAARMLDDAAPIQASGGRLSAADPRTTGELRAVVAAAARDEAAIGAAGIGMALSARDGPPATAHVLPIADGALRSRLLPKGAAAVFVASDRMQPPIDLAAVADLYHLSGAETRLLQRLMQGDSLGEAASTLCISQNTAKTHLSRIFAKTGTQRQAGLVALVNRLAPPVAPGAGED